MAETLGQLVRRLRTIRGLSQEMLARAVGVDRAYISRIEKGVVKRPSARVIRALGAALSISASELFAATGYAPDPKYFRSPEHLLVELEATMPVAIPIVSDIRAEKDYEIVDYVYRARSKATGRNIRGIVVKGFALEPEISDGDIILIDEQTTAQKGDIVLVFKGKRIKLAKFGEEDLESWHLRGVVIEVSRKLR